MGSRAGSKTGFYWNAGTGQVAQDAVRRKIGRARFLALAERAKECMEPFVPMDTGALVGSARAEAEDLKGSVVYGAPYAAAVYYGGSVRFGRDKHPLATAFWDREVREL